MLVRMIDLHCPFNNKILHISKKSRNNPVALVAEVTTLRRHMQSNHKARWLKVFELVND
jgi:hypothetical protein